MDKKDVNTAFELLYEAIDEFLNTITKEIKEVSGTQDFDKAIRLSEYGKCISSFIEKVKSLQKEWQKIFKERVSIQVGKRSKGKLKKGLRTPEEKYRIPILESLIELGGEAKVKNVLELVQGKMKSILNKYDYEKLPGKKQIRWKNTAQSVKNKMKEEGLLTDDRRKRMWKITEKGRTYYLQNRG